jgi:hypothetical protein
MQRIAITYATGECSLLCKISSEILMFNFGCLPSGHYIYVSKDVRILGYFAKTEGVLKQEISEALTNAIRKGSVGLFCC